MTDYAMPTTKAGRALSNLAPKLWKQREGDEPRMTPVQIEVRRAIAAIEAEATAAAEQRLAGLEGALRRLDHIARVFPQSLGEEAELDAALDESYRLLHPDRQGEPVAE